MPAKVFLAKEQPTQWEGVNKYTVMDPDVYPDQGLPENPNDRPHPSHPIALPGDGIWGGDLRPTHPIVIPPDPTEPPVITAPVFAAVIPVASEEPVPPQVTLPEGLTRVIMSFGNDTLAFEWFLPPLARAKPEAKK